MPASRKCMLCGKTITPSFWVCEECEDEYGLGGSWKDWPEWARRMRADTMAERRQERAQRYDDPLTRRYERKRAEMLGEPYEEDEGFVEIPFSDIRGLGDNEREDISELWT